ncbi:hypothetical protein C0585_04185 [Candidatus Woesearchaeota archaeon]|nr:MAG: hypothetical protein C0585_04185 [Candidatus Woesearchaeota archaeon]
MAIVMKFGGTSVGNSQRINQTCEIIISRIDQDPVVVVSAVGGVTDMLINGARSISVNERSVDEVIEDIIIKHNTILDELEIDRNLLDDLFESLKDTYDSLNRISAENMDLITSFGERMS